MCIAETSAADQLDQTYAEILENLVHGLADYDAVLGGSALPFSPIAPLTQCP